MSNIHYCKKCDSHLQAEKVSVTSVSLKDGFKAFVDGALCDKCHGHMILLPKEPKAKKEKTS